MGCFNTTGFLSRLPIQGGDRVVCFLGKINENAPVYGYVPYKPFSLVSPICLPIYGKYDEYGSIECIDDSPILDYIEKYSGYSIDKICYAISICGYKPIEYSLKKWNYSETGEYKDEQTKKRCEEITPILKIYNTTDIPVLLFEHESIYNNFVKGDADWTDWDNEETNINIFYNALNSVKKLYDENTEYHSLLENVKISLFGSMECNIGWVALDVIMDKKNTLNDKDREFYQKLEDIGEIKPLMYRGEQPDAFQMLNKRKLIDIVDVFIECKTEIEKTYNLYMLMHCAPMYLGLSKTAGEQWYDASIFDKLYTDCKNFANKLVEEQKKENY